MDVDIKVLHEDAIIPTYATPGSACFDLYAVNVHGATAKEKVVLKKFDGSQNWDSVRMGQYRVVDTGLAFEIPDNYVMLIFSRSGHGFKNNVRLSNCVGVIDSDYRGEVKVKLYQDSTQMQESFNIKDGDRIAQAMVVPIERISFNVVEELSETTRGIRGFGST